MKMTTVNILANGFYTAFAVVYFIFYMSTGIILFTGMNLICGHMTNTPIEHSNLYPYDAIYGNLLMIVSVCESIKAFRWIKAEVIGLSMRGQKHENKQNNV